MFIKLFSLAMMLGSYIYAYVDTTPRVKSVTYPTSTGIVVNYSYYPNVSPTGTGNGDQRLEEIAATKGSTPITAVTYTYNPTGTFASMQRQDGSATPNKDSYTYDNVYQLTNSVNKNTSTGTTINENLYQYDASGNNVAETKTSGTTVKQFNSVNELAATGSTSATQAIGGHASVPITTLSVDSVPATISGGTNFVANVPLLNGTNVLSIQGNTATLGSAAQRVQLTTSNSIAPTPLTFDKNGNLLQDAKGNTYQYNGLDQLTKITYPNLTSSHYSFNASGQRTSITQTAANGTTTSTLLNVYRGGSLSQQRTSTNTVSSQIFALGEVHSGVSSTKIVDATGTPFVESNSSGSTTGTQTYDSSGNQTASTGTDSSTTGWMGMYNDPTSGDALTSSGAYDSSTGMNYGGGNNFSPGNITDAAAQAAAQLFSPQCFGQSALQSLQMVGLVATLPDALGAEATAVIAEEGEEGLVAMDGINPSCFVAGTPVATACGSVSIEKIKVGDRVLSADSQAQKSDTLVNSSWQTVKLKLDGPHAVDVVWLRPPQWVAQLNIHVGGKIFYDDPEMSVRGWATVVDIGRAPPLGAGPGRVVTSTVINHGFQVIRMTLSSGPAIEATPTHPVYSTTRQRFVRVGDLKIGEHLASRDNKMDLVVVSLEKEPQTRTVYNLEVESDHHYFVGDQQLLVHNDNGQKLFPNLSPEDQPIPITRYFPSQDSSGAWFVQDGVNPSGDLVVQDAQNLHGSYNYVVQDGQVITGSPFDGHIDLGQGQPVQYAGNATFDNGTVTSWNNDSGHYQPTPQYSYQAPFPQELFTPVNPD